MILANYERYFSDQKVWDHIHIGYYFFTWLDEVWVSASSECRLVLQQNVWRRAQHQFLLYYSNITIRYIPDRKYTCGRINSSASWKVLSTAVLGKHSGSCGNWSVPVPGCSTTEKQNVKLTSSHDIFHKLDCTQTNCWHTSDDTMSGKKKQYIT